MGAQTTGPLLCVRTAGGAAQTSVLGGSRPLGLPRWAPGAWQGGFRLCPGSQLCCSSSKLDDRFHFSPPITDPCF